MTQSSTTRADPPLVRLRGVTKRFGAGPLVLDGIDLSVAKGEFISLIGPSGCGKSTLLRLLAGLTEASGGELIIDGMTPENAREEMAFIFQEATLLPWRTVRGNLELLLQLRGSPKHERRTKAERLASLVGLGHALDFYPRQLSGGMKMRASVARALSLSPRVLLLDEPFGALDEMTRDRLNEELLRLHAEAGWTAFFVTHSVAEAVFLSTRVLILSANPGRLARSIEVPFPRPRGPELREDPAFLSLVAETSAALRAVHR